MKAYIGLLALATVALASPAAVAGSAELTLAVQVDDPVSQATPIAAVDIPGQTTSIAEAVTGSDEDEEPVPRRKSRDHHHHTHHHPAHEPDRPRHHRQRPPSLVRWIARVLGIPPPPRHHRHRQHYSSHHERPEEGSAEEGRPHHHRPRLSQDDEEGPLEESPRHWREHHHHRRPSSDRGEGEVVVRSDERDGTKEGANHLPGPGRPSAESRRPPFDGPQNHPPFTHRHPQSHHFHHGPPPGLKSRFRHFLHSSGFLADGIAMSLPFLIMCALFKIGVVVFVVVKVTQKIKRRMQVGREGRIQLEEEVVAEKAVLPR